MNVSKKMSTGVSGANIELTLQDLIVLSTHVAATLSVCNELDSHVEDARGVRPSSQSIIMDREAVARMVTLTKDLCTVVGDMVADVTPLDEAAHKLFHTERGVKNV